MNDRPLIGRSIVISGAGRGLGRALAIIAADRGARPILLGRDLAALQATANDIEARCERRPMIQRCDLAVADDIRQACEAITSQGSVDALINNAAPYHAGALHDLSDKDLVAMVNAGVGGTLLLTKGFLPALKASPVADLITIISTSGLLSGGEAAPSAVFHAIKHAQSGFSDRLVRELKPYGVRVSAIYPPYFAGLDPLDPAWCDNRIPIAEGRMTTREVVEATLFILAAPRSVAFPMVTMANASVVEAALYDL